MSYVALSRLGRFRYAGRVARARERGTSEAGSRCAITYGPRPPARGGRSAAWRLPVPRGNFPDGYRGRLWTIRQYSGFGTPEESNERYRYLLAQGAPGSRCPRPAHPVRVRLRPPRRRGGRPRRRRPRHPRRRRDPVRPDPLDRDQHQLHDQRHRRDPAFRVLRGRRRAARASPRAKRGARSRTTSSRSTSAAAPGSGRLAVAAADRRHDRVLRAEEVPGSTPSRWPAPTSATPVRTPRRRWRSRS